MMQEMWNAPPGFRPSKSAPCSPAKPIGVARTRSESFHVTHKVPVGDTPYVRAKHVQLVDKDPEKAIPLFWSAINAGDRVDSALKDMAIVMKQQNRAEEAIEAIKSLRHRCSDQAQESLDNILLDLYKRCGRLDDQTALLRHKIYLIQQGLAFNGKRTKTARSQGKKFQVSVEEEATRLLGNLGWALMQQNNYEEAEDAYRRALSIAPDNNKMCNLGICLMKQGRIFQAKDTLRLVKPAVSDGPRGVDSHLKAYERAQQMLQDLESERMKTGGDCSAAEQSKLFESFLGSSSIWQPQPCKDHSHSVQLPSIHSTTTAGVAKTSKPAVIPRFPPQDEFPDENSMGSNNIVPKQLSLAYAYIGGGQKGAYGNSLNIDATPFCPTTGLTKEPPLGLNQFHDTLKRTRSGNVAPNNQVNESTVVLKPQQQQQKPSHPPRERESKLRRRSLSFEDATTGADFLPDDKDFEDAIICAVLNSNDAAVGNKSNMLLKVETPLGMLTLPKKGVEKRLKVFQDITLSWSPSPKA